MSTLKTDDQWLVPVLACSAAVIGVTYLIKSIFWPSYPANIPPFPEKPYPIIGHLPYLAKRQREKFQEWRKTTGDIYSLYFGSNLVIIINGYKLMKEAFVKNADLLSSRPPRPEVDDSHLGVTFANGPLWKEQRSISISILKSFGMGKASLANKINEEVSVYLDTLTALDGKPSDVSVLTSVSISNIICSIIVGKRFDYGDPFFISFLDCFKKMVRAAEATSPVMIWPWLRFIPGNFLNSKTRNICFQKVLTDFCDRFIELSEKQRNEDAPETFITSYLREMERLQKQGKETTLSKKSLRLLLLQLFLNGTDTTATTVMWFIAFMLQHPHIQKKMHDEISEIVGRDRMPDIQDRPKLPFSNAVIMETQRLGSIAAINMPRCTSGEVTIQGYTIPANTSVFPSMDSVLLDEDTWEEPHKFKPERFLDSNGHLTKPEAFIPFSFGEFSPLE
ncbi:cytochrome p450 2u1 [Plakobranchus ocellatus]|uniref:Cytochrome p450 2u1 n=1 Tax=Plakobranchus ocellatus TaxID=259542 RepID=A0AAV4DDZ1_9GAST|nr:cytochrome p450 2u1 [Plakobranchus ocellatus]